MNMKKRLPLINSKDKQFLQIFFKKVQKNDDLQSEIEHNIEMINDINSKMKSYLYSTTINLKMLDNSNNKGSENSASIGKLAKKTLKFTESTQNESALTDRSKCRTRTNESIEALNEQLYLPHKVSY